MIDTVHRFRHAWDTLLFALLISMLAHVMTIGVMLMIVVAMDPANFSWRMGVLIPLGLVANGVPLTPGGLGVGEAAFSRLFALAGLRGGAEMLLGWRLLSLLVAIPGFLVYLHGKRQFLQHGAAAAPAPASRVGSTVPAAP